MKPAEFIKARNEAMNPIKFSEYSSNVRNYLKCKYENKGMSIAMLSHRFKDIDVLQYTDRLHVDDILMHKDDIVYSKNIFARMLTLFDEHNTLDRIKDVDGEPMFSNLPRYQTEENVHYYQIVAVGFVLLPGDRFLFLRNNEKHTRLPNLTTMVQGHVEANYHISSMSAKQFMEYELCRELQEEVLLTSRGVELKLEELAKNASMKKIIYSIKNEVSREHVGALSIIDLRHYDDIQATSKEESHDVLIGKIHEIVLQGNLDNWSEIVINAITSGELTFKNTIK